MNKKIILIIPKLSNGGIEKVSSELSRNLSDSYSQIVYSIMYQEHSYGFREEPIIYEAPLGKGIIGKVFVTFGRILLLRKIYRENPDAIFLSMGERCNIINSLSFHQGKKILTTHSILSTENKHKGMYGYLGGIISKLLYSRADHVIAVSNSVKSDLLDYAHLKSEGVSVIYNGHDLYDIEKKSLDKVEMYQGQVICAVGRITHAKALWHLIRSLSEVKKTIPDVVLLIVGAPEGKEDLVHLEKIIEKFNLEDNVKILGYLDNPYPYIKQSKALLSTSLFEGFGCVIVESLSLGVPIICTNSMGTTEILLGPDYSIDDEVVVTDYGKIIPKMSGNKLIDEPLEDNEKLLAREIVKTLMNEQYLPSTLKEKAQEFSSLNMAYNYENVFNKIRES